MSIQRLIGITLLAGGMLLIFFGFQSSDGLDDQISRAFTGEYTESTIWYWMLGAFGSFVGLVLAFGGK